MDYSKLTEKELVDYPKFNPSFDYNEGLAVLIEIEI